MSEVWAAISNGITWTDIIAAVGGVAAVIVSIVLGSKSLKVSRDAREDARRSADAAQDSAREAAAVARIERNREHDRLGPGPVPDIVIQLEVHPRGAGMPETLFGTVTVPRDYRVRAVAVAGNSSSPISLDLLLHAGRPYRFAIEQWTPDRMEAKTEYVLFRFWPPADVDNVDTWSCSCDRPQSDGERTPGHWEWRIPVQHRRRQPRKAVVLS